MEFAMKTSPSFAAARRLCLSLLSATALALPMASHAQLQDINYLLPAPGTLPAFGPWMLAQAKGYYEQEGLKVSFVTARGGVDVAKQIGAGNAVIGGAIGDTPIIARSQGIPVKAVAVLGAGSLTQLVSHKDEKIESPRELKGRTVTVLAYTDTTYYALLGMLSKVGLSKNDVNIQAAGPAGVWQQFAAKKASAMAGVPDWTVSAMEAGAQVDIMPADIYFKSMAQAILASDETIAKNPQLIQKLVRATLKGMKDIMADPKAAAAAYVNHVSAHKGKEASIEKVFEMYNKYVYAAQKVPGTMDEERLGELQKFYVGNSIVPKEVPVKELYTNQFVGK
jgi:NitT/TauT family transport system substrate-binding protein